MTLQYEGAVAPGAARRLARRPAGSTVALVGATGSGKTTLVQLLPRLYDVTAGAVLIDGADVRDVDVASLRARDRGGRRRALPVQRRPSPRTSPTRAPTPRARRSSAAARRAQAHDFIARLPDGYDTRVGERGLTLSGGQRQRVAIARAFLADPRILILDDATSSVDASTEQRDQGRAARGHGAGARRSSSPTGCRRSRWPTASSCSRTARSPPTARHDELLDAVRAVPRDRREGPARPGLPHAQGARARGGGAVTSGDRGRPRGHPPRRAAPAPARHRRAAGASCAGSSCCSRPTGRAWLLMFARAGARHRGGAGSRAAGQDGHRRRHPRRATAARSTSSSSPSSSARSWSGRRRYAQTYLVRLGRPARAGRPAPADLPPPAGDAGRLLRAPARGRADLAHDQRRRGAQLAGHRHRRHAVPGVADAARLDRDPALLRRRAGAADLPDLPGHGASARWPSGSPAPTPTGARARRSARSPPTCRRRCRASGSCAPSRRSRATARSSPSSTRPTAAPTSSPSTSTPPTSRPSSSSAAVATVGILIVGGRQAINGDIEVGVLVGFIAALNGFFDPIGQLSQVYTTYQSGMAALDKIFELLDDAPELTDRPDAHRARRASAARSASRTSPSATAPSDGVKLALEDVSLRRAPRARRWRSSAPPARASRPSPSSSRASTTPRTGACSSTATTCATCPRDSLRSQMGIVPQEAFLFSGTIADNIAFGRPDARRRRDRGRRARGRRVGLRRGAARGAATPRSASAASSSRPASASCSPSPARWSPTRASSSSTRRRRTSTCTPRAASRRACGGCSPGARRSSSPTACRRSASRGGSSCSTRAGSSSRAATTSSSRRAGAYAALYADWAAQAAA